MSCKRYFYEPYKEADVVAFGVCLDGVVPHLQHSKGQGFPENCLIVNRQGQLLLVVDDGIRQPTIMLEPGNG